MHLYLTNRSHLNTSYVNEDGQVFYKVETPNKFFNRVATIKRILPVDIPSRSSPRRDHPPGHEYINDNDVEGDVEYDEVPCDVDEKEDLETVGEEVVDIMKDRFNQLAEITFNVITSSRLRFADQDVETSAFFTKKGFGWHGRNRVFTGPDGLEYQWILGARVPELFRTDSAKTPVARFHRRRLGVLRKRRPASLEIFPAGMHMIDVIMITFVYIQKIRNDSERSAQSH